MTVNETSLQVFLPETKAYRVEKWTVSRWHRSRLDMLIIKLILGPWSMSEREKSIAN